MQKIFNSIFKSLNVTKIVLLFCFTIIFFSISSSFEYLKILSFNSTISLTQLINFFRVFLNLVCFLILIIMCIKYIEIKKINLLLVFFFLFFFLQIPGTIYVQNNYDNLLLVISSLNTIFVLVLAVKKFSLKEFNIFFYILFFFLTMVLLINFIDDLIDYFSRIDSKFYGQINIFFGDLNIRSSGNSRISLILLVIYSSITINHVKSKWVKYVPISIFATLIFLYQSRITILLLLIFLIIEMLKMKRPIFISIISYLFIPIILFFLLSAIKTSIVAPKTSNNSFFEKLKDTTDKSLRETPVNNKSQFTSGRIGDWLEIYKTFNYEKNLYFGYGSQGDRYLINQTASNGLIYAFSSSGLFGLLFFLLFTLYSLFFVLKYFLQKNKKDNLTYCCSTIVLLILIRSIVESSYAHFGIDYIFMILAMCVLSRNNKLYKHVKSR